MSGIDRRMLTIMAAAGGILMITMGMRQTLGLYIAPIIDSTHVGYAAMSFAMAVGQLMWGVAQPMFGALADRQGPLRVLVIGALMLAVGETLRMVTLIAFDGLAGPATQTASAPGNSFLSRLNGWPARTPTDASRASSRMHAHGSGPMWFAIPSSQWTSTTYSLPVSRRTCVKTLRDCRHSN